MISSNRKYFASLEINEMLPELYKKVENFDTNTLTSGIFDRMRRSFRMYYGYSGDGNHASSRLTFSGDSGELSLIKVNEFRNLIQHLLVMCTQQRPVMDVRATNSDYRSQVQAILAKGILEYYMKEKKLEQNLRSAVETALILSEGFIGMFWNPSSGEVYGVNPDTQTPVYEGDVEFENFTPLDVIRDVYKDSNKKLEWVIIRRFKNKYNLIAKNPELEDKILNISTKDMIVDRFKLISSFDPESDDIPVYEFFHAQTEAVPLGRHTIFINNEIQLHDGNLPYRDIPVFRISPSDIQKTIFGYTVAFDLMGVQEIVDGLVSAVASNQNAFAVQNIWMRPGADINYSAISEGMNVIESETKPEPLQLTASSPETFTFINMMLQRMETLSGVNSVARGNPEASLKSGSALALVASQAIQFSSGLQQSYAQLVEDVGTSLIKMLRDFASVPRVAAIAGKNHRMEMKEFTGEDLKDVNRVVIELGNPLSRTIAGREQIANNLLQMGFIKTPEAYYQVLDTGQLEPLIEGDRSEMLLIKSENEKLSVGEGVQAIDTDNHTLHIKEHKNVLSQPEIRTIPDIVQVTLTHIQEHITALQMVDPVLLQTIGVQPVAPPPPVNTGEVINPQNPTMAEAENVNMPNMPTNPLTGEQFNPQAGA